MLIRPFKHHPANCTGPEASDRSLFSDRGSEGDSTVVQPTWRYRHSAFQLPSHLPCLHPPPPSFLPIMFYVSTSELEVLGATPGSCCELAPFSLLIAFICLGLRHLQFASHLLPVSLHFLLSILSASQQSDGLCLISSNQRARRA